MLKYLLVLALSLPVFTTAAAEASESRAPMPMQVTLAGGEIVKTAAVRTTPAPAREVRPAPQQPNTVSWKMVLAAVALMVAVALRRFGSGSR